MEDQRLPVRADKEPWEPPLITSLGLTEVTATGGDPANVEITSPDVTTIYGPS